MYNLVVMETFGQWLLRCRKERGWTQKFLHEKSGVSESYISTLERSQPHSITGAKLRPEPDKVELLAKALGENVDQALIIAGYSPNNETTGYFKGLEKLSPEKQKIAKRQIRAIIDALAEEEFTDEDFDYIDDE